MVYILSSLITTTDNDLLIFMEIALGNTLNLTTHRSREKQGVAIGGNSLKYLIDTLSKSHIEHLVGLIEHYIINLFKICLSSIHKVDKTSRGGNNHLCPMAQGANLILNGCSSIDGNNIYAIHILGEVLQVVGNLQTEFASGTKDKGLSVTTCGVKSL